MSHAVIGIDVGNYDTKSQHTITPSSFVTYKSKNPLAKEYVFANGTCYVPTEDRNRQQQDKTVDDYCLNVSLFAVAKEILHQIESKNPDFTKEQKQAEIDKITDISIGVGLPAGYFKALKDKTQKCYLGAWGSSLSFEYGRGADEAYNFSMTLRTCLVFPQDLTPVLSDPKLEIPKDSRKYYVLGIGGGTCDVVPVNDGFPEIDKIITLKAGSTVMYATLIRNIQAETGDTLDYNLIEDILLDRHSYVSDEVKTRVKELAGSFVSQLIEDMDHNGVTIKNFPCVFVGGGAILMKPYIEASKRFVRTEFMSDVNINAKSYAAFVSKSLKAE